MKHSYARARLAGPGWEELGQSSRDNRHAIRHNLSNTELVQLVPKPLLQKYCDLIRSNTVSEEDTKSPYRNELRKGCRILVKARAQTKIHFMLSGTEYNFTVDDKHLLYFEAKGEPIDYPSVEVSHDCHREKEYECVNVDHFILESNETNNRRQGCSVAAYCENCFLVTFGGTKCFDGKHGEGKKLCRPPLEPLAALPHSKDAKRQRLATLEATRIAIDQHIADLQQAALLLLE